MVSLMTAKTRKEGTRIPPAAYCLSSRVSHIVGGAGLDRYGGGVEGMYQCAARSIERKRFAARQNDVPWIVILSDPNRAAVAYHAIAFAIADRETFIACEADAAVL
jgi:hypothetical protein